MIEYLLQQGEYVLRIVIAAICAAVIGYERKTRGKEAGIRTHLIVAVASALMTIISKYGFSDIVINSMGVRGADPAKIAAQIVSGVSFLGAGMIYFSNKTPHGLTTAAGIWATAGLGMAIGAGMYIVGIATTLIMLLSHFILHLNLKFLRMPNEEKITIVIDDDEVSVSSVQHILNKYDIQIDEMSFERSEDSKLKLNMSVTILDELNSQKLFSLLKQSRFIKSFTMAGMHGFKALSK